jgi:hypothetical protein
MLLDVLAAVARKDYDDRRRRQAQGKPRQRLRAATGSPRGYGAQCLHRQPARGGPLLELHSGHDGLQPRHGREGGKTGCRCRLTAFASSNRRPCLTAGALRFVSRMVGPVSTFYWDDQPSRRLRPETLNRETALEEAKAVARAARRN